ncbi:Flavonol 4'-sulfotransferase [Triticum urartu]|uniref:Sulfotransferase n=1 Tax=Triticum urartu TaxID=4572 RepID=M8A8I7_TRIUA|nr:Flavonol 4'-sulfotransferase [Triticum urartu]
MATNTSGPVPFTDVDDGTVPKRPAKEEFGDLVAALPRKHQAGLELRLYQGFWLPDHWVAGTVVFQRRFAPRPDDVILASYPKCGTTWLKALAFATMTRDAYPAPAQHPLLRLNPHDCVPFEKMKGLEVNKKGSAGAYHAMPRDSFFRKGVAGDWVNHMTPEMATRLDEVVRDKFRGTGLAAP